MIKSNINAVNQHRNSKNTRNHNKTQQTTGAGVYKQPVWATKNNNQQKPVLEMGINPNKINSLSNWRGSG